MKDGGTHQHSSGYPPVTAATAAGRRCGAQEGGGPCCSSVDRVEADQLQAGSGMDRLNGGMKRSSSENATNATRDPETMSSTATDLSITKPWKQRFSFRQPRRQHVLEEVGFYQFSMGYLHLSSQLIWRGFHHFLANDTPAHLPDIA